MEIRDELAARRLPDILRDSRGEKVISAEDFVARREEIKSLLCSEEYGFLPPKPLRMEVETLSEESDFCAGKVTLTRLLLRCTMEFGEFSFPVSAAIPKSGTPLPAVVHISFTPDVPDRYMPTEEICDGGYAVFSFFCSDVSENEHKGDQTGGLPGLFYAGRTRTGSDPGRIAFWAWGVMRVMDYVETLSSIDQKNVAVVGHSRLGKTALLASALDERFAFAISNDSGCSGAALSRGKVGESVGWMCDKLWFWFCENYKRYAGREQDLPFDQHFLLAMTAPRKVYVASAEDDEWADPASEFLSCWAASPVYGLFGEEGFIAEDRLPRAGDVFHGGNIGYHLRSGCHYLSRYDWQMFIQYMDRHRNR